MPDMRIASSIPYQVRSDQTGSRDLTRPTDDDASRNALAKEAVADGIWSDRGVIDSLYEKIHPFQNPRGPYTLAVR